MSLAHSLDKIRNSLESGDLDRAEARAGKLKGKARQHSESLFLRACICQQRGRLE